MSYWVMILRIPRGIQIYEHLNRKDIVSYSDKSNQSDDYIDMFGWNIVLLLMLMMVMMMIMNGG